jgi:hypothetical protein
MSRKWWAAATVFLLVPGCKVSSSSSTVEQAISPSAPDVCKSELVITPTGGTCPETCFDVTGLKNITHLFVDVAPCPGGATPAPEDVTVVVTYTNKLGTTTETIDPAKYHDKGGPCNPNGQKGEDNIPRLFWFPLTQNQDLAHVCVTTPSGGTVTLGGKVCEECHSSPGAECCIAPPDMLEPPPDMPKDP